MSFILSLVFVLALGVTSCGGGGGNTTSSRGPAVEDSQGGGSSSENWWEDLKKPVTINFHYNGSDKEQAVFAGLVSEFNAQYGGKIRVKGHNGLDYAQLETNFTGGENVPEVFYCGDGDYKRYIDMDAIANITSFVNADKDDVMLDDMWDSIYDRYYYSKTNRRSGADADRNAAWYGLPKDIGPTAIFYNEGQFTKAGIRIISVPANKLADFNNGAADDRGHTKNAISFRTSKLGVYDSRNVAINETVPNAALFKDGNGNIFFNNQIPLSWDEIRILAGLLSSANSSTGSSVYGYQTEWWFNYGWSVGGDCLEFIEDDSDPNYPNGYYDFTLVDDSANFIVKDNVSSVTVNGTLYKAGEIISYQDKLTNEKEIWGYANKDRKDKANYASELGYDKTTGNCNSNFNVLPSQRDAFVEFVRLSSQSSVEIEPGKYGYAICPTPTTVKDSQKLAEFMNGKISMLVTGRWDVTELRDSTLLFDVAPLPMYKTYNKTISSIDDCTMDRTVVNHGIEAGHSGSVALCMSNFITNENTKKAAWELIKFLAGPVGQKSQSQTGFAIPSQKSIAMATTGGPNGGGWFLNQLDENGDTLEPYNAIIFTTAAQSQKGGDWGYLPNGNAWINDWAGILNDNVRNGAMSFSEFMTDYRFTPTWDAVKNVSHKDNF